MRSGRALLALALVVVIQAAAAAQQRIQITPLTRDGRVLVTFRLAEAFNQDVLDAIHSGLTISFIYEVELRRSATIWLDRTMDSARVTATVRYDTLTRRYHVTRSHDGRIERADTTESEDTVREWLTDFERLPLFSSARLQRNAEYYLRVRAHTSPRNASFLWPWDRHDVAGLVKFTFIPY